MPIEVKMAKLSPTMESGQMVKWLVKVGDKVKEGDTLAEVQTDKAVMPMESFEEGTVARLDVKEGDEIALGQRVLVLAKKVKDTDGRISAKRLLPVARAAGYSGSARNLRRAVAQIKTDHRRKRRLYRPWVPTPGQHRDGGGAPRAAPAPQPPTSRTVQVGSTASSVLPRLPFGQSSRTWTWCQMRVPAPTVASAATSAVGWTYAEVAATLKLC